MLFSVSRTIVIPRSRSASDQTHHSAFDRALPLLLRPSPSEPAERPAAPTPRSAAQPPPAAPAAAPAPARAASSCSSSESGSESESDDSADELRAVTPAAGPAPGSPAEHKVSERCQSDRPSAGVGTPGGPQGSVLRSERWRVLVDTGCRHPVSRLAQDDLSSQHALKFEFT